MTFPFVWTNGRLHEFDAEVAFPPEASSLGVIETFLWEHDGFRCASRHRARLARGFAAIGRQAPLPATLETLCRRLLEANGVERAVFRLEVHREAARASLRSVPGSGSEIDSGSGSGETLSVLVVEGPAVPESEAQRIPEGGHKTTRRETYEQALRAAGEAGMDEALLLDASGSVCEGSFTNVFAVLATGVVTPDLARGGVAGICREWLLEGPDSIATSPNLAPEALFQAEELILTNAVRGPLGVRLLVAPGRPARRLPGAEGPVCRDWALRWKTLRHEPPGL